MPKRSSSRNKKTLRGRYRNLVTSNGPMHVNSVLGLVLGDNLGVNTVLGFVSSFSAIFFCRFCKEVKTSTHTACITKPNLLRNKENYIADVLANDASTTGTGIKENCIFNTINSFHVTTNFAVDMMHDIFEGVCHFNLFHVINKFIEMRYFDLNTLNNRKFLVNYSDIEIGNISPAITSNNLSSFHLKMTAREMMTFVHIFPLMIGDLVPHDDEV